MVSIIIVNYHVKKELFDCLQSIYTSKPKCEFEIIVVDNDEKKNLFKDLHKKFPQVKYVENNNKGYGQGNNVGVSHAKGEYLFILNPDTKLYSNCIDELALYLNKHTDVGIAAPFLYQKNDQIFPLQGAKILDPLSAIFTFSFINKLFPNNPVAKRYWLFDKWNGKSVKYVASVPGTAFMIRRGVYEKIGGFDEKFFLYFEEQDLCKRVDELGCKQVMLPQAKVFHALGKSTKKSDKKINKVFMMSRFYYLKKHFGLISALLTEGILRINKYGVLLSLVITVGLFLRTFRINELMPFIGDQGWFYLSARDFLLTGNIPLVGIESSHPWLHQGALWTYLLTIMFFFFGFHPVVGAYLGIFLDVFSIYLLYKIGSAMFSKRIGLLAATFYAFSPLVITNSRMPYHTNPIPLFTMIFIYCLYKLMSGHKFYFPLVILSLAILYNLELATFILSFVTGIILLGGIITKQKWARAIFDVKLLVLSIIAFIIPMLPMLIYDISHGFPQTVKFIVWIGYRVLVFLGYPAINPFLSTSFKDMMLFFSEFYRQLIFPYNGSIALMIIVLSFLYSISVSIKKRYKENVLVILVISMFTTLGMYIVKTPSSAYLPMLFPSTILLVAIFFDKLIAYKRVKIPVVVCLMFLFLFNIFFLPRNNYSFIKNYENFIQRMTIAKSIVHSADGKEYNLVVRVNNKQLDNYSKQYEYLTWWLGHGPSKDMQKTKFIISELNNRTYISKEE